MEGLNWKTLWENPKEVLALVTSNEKTLLRLEELKQSLLQETRMLHVVQKGGFIYEGRRKDHLLKQAEEIDPVLVTRIQPLSNKDEIVRAIEERILEYKKTIGDTEGKLSTLMKEEQLTLSTADQVVSRYMEIREEIGAMSEKELLNISANYQYESELGAAVEDGTFTNRLKHFEEQALRSAERIRENQAMQERIVHLFEELGQLQQRALAVQKSFERETEEISVFRRLFMKFFGKKEEVKEEKEEEVGGLIPAFGH